MEKGTNTSDAAKSDKEEKESEKGGPTLFFSLRFFFACHVHCSVERASVQNSI